LNDDGTEVVSKIIFVGGLAPSCTKDILRHYFRKHGNVLDCSITQKGRAPGLGFVHFDAIQPVEKIISMGMHQIQGRWVEVRKALPASKTTMMAEASASSGSKEFSRDDLRAEMLKRHQEKQATKKRKDSSSTSSSSSSSEKEKKKKKKSERKRSPSTLSSESSARPKKKANAADLEQDSKNPEIEEAKAEVLKRLMALKAIQPSDARMKEWRLLLREWHPDKNPERVEVATAVFQFLQKGRAIVASD